ncbi:MAG: pantoate--beta-alanine ligase [Ichthyobacteriaceae bacterium]|nr:pantoate--beta-alanine ligase [Ichthyobacteriaceae bacterium]
MLIFNSKVDLNSYITSQKSLNKTIGFVPTMGALHNGHTSLVNYSTANNDITIVSIFVNPTQFNNPNDLKKYPRTLGSDSELLAQHNVDVIYAPTTEDIYGKNVESVKYNFDGLDEVMEGEHRIGHFDGVGTIVKLLFDNVQPDNAYFGEKDFQQLQIIKKLVEITDLTVKVIGCAIIREDDGLAMSSRNVRLSSEQRTESPLIYKTIKQATVIAKTESIDKANAFVEKTFKESKTLKLEYFEIRDEQTLSLQTNYKQNVNYRAFVAVFAGDVRLIDNVKV